MKPYTVVTAIHPDIARAMEGERIEHYTSLLQAKNSRAAALAGCREHYESAKADFEDVREMLQLDKKVFYPAKIIVLLVFEGHQNPYAFGWSTGMQPRDDEIVKPKRRKT